MDLPQPFDGNPYKYLTYDEIPSLFTSLKNSVEPPLESSIVEPLNNRIAGLSYDTLVWVLLSKGKGKGASELFRRARVRHDVPYSDPNPKHDNQQQDDPRVLVQYPSGSTYRVRSSSLLPVLEPMKTYPRIVVVADETPQYRRTAVVHTCVGDSFLEIGCDFGTCTDKVRNALMNIPHAPSLVFDDFTIRYHEQDKYCVSCIGIDKSRASIDIAKERFPHTFFSMEDALTPDGTRKLRTLCRDILGRHPTVVAIDINGNRDIVDVIECLSQVIRPKGDDVVMNFNWELPRLIIVKSRFLYKAMKEQHLDGTLRY